MFFLSSSQVNQICSIESLFTSLLIMLYREPFVKSLRAYFLVPLRGILCRNGISTEPYSWMGRMMQNVSSERKLLSTAEASRISGLGRQYIERLLRMGRLAGIKPGHDWLVYEDSLQAFLAQPRKRGPKGPRKTSASVPLTPPSVDADTIEQKKNTLERDETIADDERRPLHDDSMTSS
jgi:excisionase family DNA binding protein